MSGHVTSDERIFSLLLALAATKHGATKSELLHTVHGYSIRYEDPANRSNVERQFERDKDALRDIGIPIETFEPPGEPGNNQVTRYRINPELLRLPDSVRFSPEELRLLSLASFVWRDSTMAHDARLASMKLSGLGEHLDTQLLGIAPRISASEPSMNPLQTAAEHHQVVEFTYRKAGESRGELRRVAPLALNYADGRWHLIAWDYVREANRVFLLSRISGPLKTLRETFDASLLETVESAARELSELRDTQVAVLEILPDSLASVRLTPEMNYLDEAIFAEEITAYGAEVFVVSPQSLRDRVIENLRLIASVHAQGEQENAS